MYTPATVYQQTDEIINKQGGFYSVFQSVGNVEFPEFKHLRIMMMPFRLFDTSTIPDQIAHWRPFIKQMSHCLPMHIAEAIQKFGTDVCCLTIDEQNVEAGTVQRKPGGLHVDGMYKGVAGAGSWSGGGGSWGSVGNGMLVVTNTDDTTAYYSGYCKGKPQGDGHADHLVEQLPHMKKYTPKAGEVIWADGMCLHEGLPVQQSTSRQFVRISLPNNNVWHDSYTKNPTGVQPLGKIVRCDRNNMTYAQL